MTSSAGSDAAAGGVATATGYIGQSELAVGERVAGRFRVVAMVGLGGMGIVYRAFDEQLGVDVALKLLRPEFAAREDAFARFRQELLLARQVSSAHVVRIHDLVAHDGRWLIGMDYVDGGSLESVLERRGALPVDDAVAITRQVALGLAAAHAQSVVHRDLKPANVLVDARLRAWVSDFGVARSAGTTGLTASGVIVGTPEYLSPEQARGGPIDARSDLYALGLILFEMLTGRLPFEQGTAAEMLAQRIVRPAPTVRRLRADVPRWLDRLVARLLALRPSRRFADASAVVAAIDRQRVGWQVPEARRLLMLGAAAALLAGGGWLAANFDEVLAPRLLAAGMVRERSEWLVLPLVAEGDARELSPALARLAASELRESGLDVADPARVARSLELLGLGADDAPRQAARLDAMLPHRRLVGGRIVLRDGRLDLALQRYESGDPRPLARADVQGITADTLPLALRRALADLGVPLRAESAAPWPGDLALLKAWGATLREPTPAHAAVLAEALAREPRFAAGWFDRLQLARRDQPAAELQRLADDALAALGNQRGRDAERTRALAELIGGKPAQAATRLAAQLDVQPHDTALRLLRVEALDEAGEHDAARRELDALLAADPQDPDALLARGRNALRSDDARQAVDVFLGPALQLFTRLEDVRGRADTLQALGVGYERLGQPTPAAEQFERAAQLRELAGDARGAATSLRNVAYGHGLEGRFDAARAAFSRARALLEPLGDAAALAALANDEGLIAEESGDFAGAEAHYREVLALRRTLGDAGSVAEAALNLGFVYLHRGEFQSARLQLDEAERTFRQTGDRSGVVRAGQKLAMLDLADGAADAARARLEDGLLEAESLQLVEEQAVSLVELAEVDRQQGKLGDAMRRLERAAALFGARGDQRGLAEVALRRAAVALDAGDAAMLATTLAALVDSPPPSIEQQAMRDLLRAEAALRTDRAADALPAADAAMAAAQASASHTLQVHAGLARVRALAAAARPDEARRQLVAVDSLLADHPTRAARLDRASSALALAEGAAVAPAYASVRALLASAADWPGAAHLHEIAARRFDAAGLAAPAAAAREAAAAAHARLRASLDPAADAGAGTRP
jgi:tetratricopeptide (TPR) repeat protein